MLVSYHFPIADLRSFFTKHLGKVTGIDYEQIGSNTSGISKPIFLRSIGMPKKRILGPGDATLNEMFFFSIDKQIRYTPTIRNRRPSLRAREEQIRSRYYVFDEVMGRFDICIPVHPHKALNPEQKKPEEIYKATNILRCSIEKKYLKQKSAIREFGPGFANFLQSRTTKEIFLKKTAQENKNYTSVFSGAPILIIECLPEEITLDQNIQEIDLEIDNLKLYHWYPRNDIRSWIIVRNDNKRQTYQDGRMLRLYLNRIYCQQSMYRIAVKNLPKLTTQIHAEQQEELSTNIYTHFLNENRKYMSALSKSISKISGRELGPASKYAHDMISGNESKEIEEFHKNLITRKNILNNLLEELQKELHRRSQYMPDKIEIHNQINNKYGILANTEQSIKIPTDKFVQIAKPNVKDIGAEDIISRLTEFFKAYGGIVPSNRQNAIYDKIKEMADTCINKDVSGPLLLNKFNELEDLLSGIPDAKAELSNIKKNIKEKILSA